MIAAERKPADLVNGIGHEIETQFNTREKKLINDFEKGLLLSKPYLFNLADQLVTHYPQRNWNVLIIDDISARLPARFVRKVLETSFGLSLPMYFIQAGYLARQRVPKKQYSQYMHFIASNLASDSRPLVISESAGTFATAKFLLELVASEFHEVDFAVVVSKSVGDNLAANVYVGNEGQDAGRAIYNTFEGGKEKSVFHLGRILPLLVKRIITRRFPQTITISTQKLTGVKRSNDPYVAASRDEDSGQLVHYFRKRMDSLAAEYFLQKKSS